MTSYLSDLDHYRINAQVYPGWVVETHHVSDFANGKRQEPKTEVWKVERVLGKGSSAEVRLEINQESNEHRAVKRIWTTGTKLQKEYRRELMALLEFSKPKYREAEVFVEFLGWFEDHDTVYLAIEYIPLGDLEHNVPAQARITEGEIRDITAQILEGLQIMHLENFVHRDLKPKNVLVCRGPPRWWVKLTDFGLSKKRTEDTEYRTCTGTQSYMAPEILNYVPRIDPTGMEYTNAIDLWALGCIIYRLASGVVPFPPGLSLINFCADRSGFPFHFLALRVLGLQFLNGLLEPYPAQRWTAQQALSHPWMTIDLDFSYLNQSGSPVGQHHSNSNAFSTGFGNYNTDTHLGLQSYQSTATASKAVSAPRKPQQVHPSREDLFKRYDPQRLEQELPVPGGLEVAMMNDLNPSREPERKFLPIDAKGKKAFSEGMTKAQLADLGLFLNIPAWEGGGPEEQRRWGGLWVNQLEHLRQATSFPNLQVQARGTFGSEAIHINRGRYQNSGTHTRNLSAPKTTISDAAGQPSFASRVTAKKGSSLAPSNSKSTKRSTRRKNSQQQLQSHGQQSAKQGPHLNQDNNPKAGEPEIQKSLPEDAKPNLSLDGNPSKQVPEFTYHVSGDTPKPTDLTHNHETPTATSPLPPTPTLPINPCSTDKQTEAQQDHRTIKEARYNPGGWYPSTPNHVATVEQDVTSAFKAFALEQRRMVEHGQAKKSAQAKANLLNDLVVFSKMFKLPRPAEERIVSPAVVGSNGRYVPNEIGGDAKEVA